MPIPLFDKLVSAFGGPYADANRVAVDDADFSGIFSGDGNTQQSLDKVDATGLGAPVSFRPVDSLALSSSNANQWFNREIRFNAAADGQRTCTLPNNADINTVIAAVPGRQRPVRITISYVGGTSNNITVNRIRVAANAAGPVITGRNQVTLQRGEAVVFEQAEDNGEWSVLSEGLIQNQGTNPLGSIVLQNDIQWDAADTPNLPSTGVVQGYAYEVINAASDGTVVFGLRVFNGDWAIWDNATFTAWSNLDDWFLIPSSDIRRMVQQDDTFLTQVTRDGVRYDLSQNVFVDPSNVVIQTYQATNLPQAYLYFAAVGTNPRTATFTNQSIQFANLVGGQLSLSVSFTEDSSSGSLPALTSVTLDYSGTVFTFPVTNISPEGGSAVVNITIPNVDYTSILNTNCTVTLNYIFNGVNFVGSFILNSLTNSLKGTLHDSIVSLAAVEATNVEMRLDTELAQIRGEISDEEASFAAIQPRISPYRNVNIEIPDINALYLDSTGSDNFPSAISQLSPVAPENPRFTVGDIAVFIAVIGGNTYLLKNLTSTINTPLLDSEPNVDLGETLTSGGLTYFVYRVTGLTVNDVLEVDTTTVQRVVAWQADIDNLDDEVDKINHELEHAALNIPDDVAGVLQHDITVTDDTGAESTATQFNRDLTGDDSIGVFDENPQTAAPVGGITSSNTLSSNASFFRGQKFVVIPTHNYSTPSFILRADDGSGTELNLLGTDLNNNLYVNVFVPAQPGGSTTVTVYPVPNGQFKQDWYTVPGHTQSNLPEDDELFFNQNVPNTLVTLNYRVRYLVNGTVGATTSRTLANVGGASDVTDSFSLSLPDGESFSITVTWQASSRQIRYTASPVFLNPNFFIYDTQVGMDYQETRIIPPTPATVRQETIAIYDPAIPMIIGIKPSVPRVTGSTNPTLIIVTNQGELSTNYEYNTLFTSTDAGHIEVNSNACTIYDYRDFTLTQPLLNTFRQRVGLPYNGFYTDDHTYETIVDFDVQMQARSSANDVVRLGQELVLTAPDSTRYRLSVANGGTLITTLIT